MSILAFVRKGAKLYRCVEVTPLGILAGTRLWPADQNNAPRDIEQGCRFGHSHHLLIGAISATI